MTTETTALTTDDLDTTITPAESRNGLKLRILYNPETHDLWSSSGWFGSALPITIWNGGCYHWNVEGCPTQKGLLDVAEQITGELVSLREAHNAGDADEITGAEYRVGEAIENALLHAETFWDAAEWLSGDWTGVLGEVLTCGSLAEAAAQQVEKAADDAVIDVEDTKAAIKSRLEEIEEDDEDYEAAQRLLG